MVEPVKTRSFVLPAPIDVGRALAPLRNGRNDPTTRITPAGWWRSFRTPEGPAALHLQWGPTTVQARAWGPGAAVALDRVPGLVGALDPGGLVTDHPVVSPLHRRAPGFRIGRSAAVWEALVPTVLAQKVTGREARNAWARMARHFGRPAPGPGDLLLSPDPAEVLAAGSSTFHPFGVERRRAETIIEAAAHVDRLERLVHAPLAEASRALLGLPGIGEWSAAEVLRIALGDRDAVSVGDYHLKHLVAWNLAAEPRGTDERMLELLQPFAGHRAHVIGLLESAGRHAPRRGPRLEVSRLESRHRSRWF